MRFPHRTPGLTRLVSAALLSAASAFAQPSLPQTLVRQASPASPAREVVAYFTSWGMYDRGYTVKDLAAQPALQWLTTINYAFGNVQPANADGTGAIGCQLGDAWADVERPWTAQESVDGVAVDESQPLRGNFQQLRALKRSHPDLRLVVSLGGWNGSKWFSDAALTEASRRTMVKSCIDLFIRGRTDPAQKGEGDGPAAGLFSGIDLDWEFVAAEGAPGNIVRPEDTRNFTLLLQEFRRQLDAIDPSLRLTVAAPSPKDASSKLELPAIARTVDFINLMTYDMHNSLELRANFHAALLPSPRDPDRAEGLTVVETVERYLKAGVPASQLVLGIPLYSRGWTGLPATNDGLYQMSKGPAPGTYESSFEDYRNLIKKQGYTRHWDAWSRSAWLFDGTTFWTLDGPESVRDKTLLVKLAGLRGVMFWELANDDGVLVDLAGRELSGRR